MTTTPRRRPTPEEDDLEEMKRLAGLPASEDEDAGAPLAPAPAPVQAAGLGDEELPTTPEAGGRFVGQRLAGVHALPRDTRPYEDRVREVLDARKKLLGYDPMAAPTVGEALAKMFLPGPLRGVVLGRNARARREVEAAQKTVADRDKAMMDVKTAEAESRMRAREGSLAMRLAGLTLGLEGVAARTAATKGGEQRATDLQPSKLGILQQQLADLTATSADRRRKMAGDAQQAGAAGQVAQATIQDKIAEAKARVANLVALPQYREKALQIQAGLADLREEDADLNQLEKLNDNLRQAEIDARKTPDTRPTLKAVLPEGMGGEPRPAIVAQQEAHTKRVAAQQAYEAALARRRASRTRLAQIAAPAAAPAPAPVAAPASSGSGLIEATSGAPPVMAPLPPSTPPAAALSPIEKLKMKAATGDVKAQAYLQGKGIPWR